MGPLRLRAHLALWFLAFSLVPLGVVVGYHLAQVSRGAEGAGLGTAIGAMVLVGLVAAAVAVVAAFAVARAVAGPVERVGEAISAIGRGEGPRVPSLPPSAPLEVRLLVERLGGALSHIGWDHRQMEAVLELARRIPEVRSVRDTAAFAAEKARELFGALHAAVLLRHDGTLELVASTLPADEQRRIEAEGGIRLGEGAAGAALVAGRTVVIDDIRSDPRYESLRPLAERLGYRCAAATPLRVRSEHDGALSVVFREPRAFHQERVEALERFAAQVGSALLSAQRLERVHALLTGAVAALAEAIELRDPYTSGHSRRMRDLALRVGRRMGLEGEELETLAMAALVHDIGKLGVPAAILNKTGPLNPEELAVVRHHAADGAKILEKVGQLQPLALLVRHHQERWDGTGYPDGLRGEEIPLGARILGVLDAYDSMTSDRPYREAMPEEVARAELRRHAGRQFDPAVVEALLEVLEEEAAA